MATDILTAIRRSLKASAQTRPWPDVAIPPGETLAETLAAKRMSQAELARRMGRPVQAINEIVRGRKAITAETALALQAVLGVPADFWMHLEGDFRLTAARLALVKATRSMPVRRVGRGEHEIRGTRNVQPAAPRPKGRRVRAH